MKRKKQNKHLKKLERRIAELERNSTAMSYYFGEVDFPKFVRLTEKTIALSEQQRKGQNAD